MILDFFPRASEKLMAIIILYLLKFACSGSIIKINIDGLPDTISMFYARGKILDLSISTKIFVA